MLILHAMAGSAQTIVPASFFETAVTPLNTIGYPNCASIDYTPFNGGFGPVNPQLTAVVTGVGPGVSPAMPNCQLWVNDQVAGWTNVFIPGPIMPTSATDVIVGNNIMVAGQYLIGLVFNSGGTVWLDIFSVTGTGSGALAIAPAGGPFNISGTAMVVGSPHIDIMAEYSTPYPAIGLPRANKFVVTWEQSGQGIWAYSASLNAPFPGVTAPINTNNLAHSPDVAAVERRNPITGVYEPWALFGYQQQISAIDMVDYYVVYQEWNLSNNAVGISRVYDIKPLVGGELVRIDAIDDYNYNNPGHDVYPAAAPATTAYFCIVATANTNGGNFPSAILEYNNLTGPWNPTDISSPPGLAGQYNLSPVVACGPGPNYTVAYNSRLFAPGYAPYFATAINWMTGVQNPLGDAYAIPKLPYVLSPIVDGIAIASTCNKDAAGAQAVFPCWQNKSQIWGKYTNNVIYTFKNDPVLGVADLSSKDYAVMPNPASDYIFLDGPEHTSNQYRYQITDITGRAVLQAAIPNGKERVDIRDLANGVYILNIYSNDQNINTFRLVKQ